MRLLVDQCLSPAVAKGLRQAGYDAVHLRDRGLGGASDVEVARCAEAEDRVLVTRDTDFDLRPGTEARHRVSVVVIRQGRDAGALNGAEEQLEGLSRTIPKVRDRLERRAVVHLDRDGYDVVAFEPHQEGRLAVVAGASLPSALGRPVDRVPPERAAGRPQQVCQEDPAELDRDDEEWGH